MKFITRLDLGILGGPDSADLWRNITDQIPDSVLLKPNVKILNIACGHGTEAAILARRMIALGIPKKKVNNSIWLLDKYNTFTNQVRNTYGFQNVITADFLTWKTDMKFDVVIGNPPYLNGLWREFIKRSCALSREHVIMIAPDGANIYSARGARIREEMVSDGVQSVTDVTKYFPTVNSGSIVCYVFNKTISANVRAFDKSSIADQIVLKVLEKSHQTLRCEIGNQSKKFIDAKRYNSCQKGLVPVLESISVNDPNKIAFISKKLAKTYEKSQYWFVTRFFGQADGSPVTDSDIDTAISHRLIAIQKIGSETAEEFQKVYCSKLFRLVIRIARNGKFDTPMFILKKLPRIDCTKIWTDQDLYDHFGLSDAEIQYVESSIQ
jgi:hypothetical protein